MSKAHASKSPNTLRAIAALLTLPLMGSGAVFGVQVTRATLLGYRVGSEILEVEEAASRLASLVWRSRGALAHAAARLVARGVRGTYSVRPGTTSDGRQMVAIRVRVESETDFLAQDEQEALATACLSCRDAYLYAHVAGNEVHVIGT